MGFNYAAEKKKFETLWARLRREYRAAGMSDAAIQKMHDFDWEVFKQERIYRLHTQDFGIGIFDEPSAEQEDKSALMKMQKTFQQDVINRKVIKNTGQLPMYLIENHHDGIVSREKYNAVQAEMARRKAAKSPSKRAPTGLSAYTSRYALSDRLVCGECGTLYRRCTWTRPDGKRVVWRCVSRLDYGKKYCHSSPTLDEAPLQQAIIAALNTVLPDLDGRIRQITEALEAEVIPLPNSGMSLGDIDRRLAELEA